MPEANTTTERRIHPRISLQIPVKYKVIETQVEQSSHTLDMSFGGIFLVSGQALEKGSIIRLDLTFPKISQMILAYAEVVWFNSTGGGLHFEAMKGEDEDTMRNYLQNISREKSFNRISN